MGVYFICCRVIQSVWSSTRLFAYLDFNSHVYPLYSTEMDEFKHDTLEPEWITIRNRIDAHEDITLRNPRFFTIERFLIRTGGGAFDMYNRMMELMYRKDTKIVVNIMNDFKISLQTI